MPATRQLLLPPVDGGFTGGRDTVVVPPEDVLAVCVVRVPDPVLLAVEPVPVVGDVTTVVDVGVWDVDPVCAPPVWLPVEPVPDGGGEMVTGGGGV